MEPPANVEKVEHVTDEVIRAFGVLIPQLTASQPPPGREELEAVVAAGTAVLLVARAPDGAIVGTATLSVLHLPTGCRAWLDDVVVDAGARGRGTGQALVQAALAHARARGARSVNLTTRPTRAAANRLYARLGFEQRDTNAYRYDLTRG